MISLALLFPWASGITFNHQCHLDPRQYQKNDLHHQEWGNNYQQN
jgi:hypothetical protein